MSTPSANGTSKPTPRMGGALTPSASTPSRNISSPAHHATAGSKTVGRSPWKVGTPSTGQTPLAGSLNVHTPTPSGPLPGGSSPAVTFDGLTGRARAGTAGFKSAAGSPAGQTPAAFSGLGLTLTPLISGLDVSQQLNHTTMLDTLGLVGRDADTWMQQRIKEIMDLLGTRWGKVSQTNVKRCVERIGGLECYWEDHPGGKEKAGERKRTLAMAGNEFIIEIGWLGESVTGVSLNFMRGNEEAKDDLGAEILRQDLVGRSIGYVEMDGFVQNLSRLARIDLLGRGKVSCFEALEGLAESMKKLWELELAKEQETIKKQGVAEIRVLCERSGRPRTHSESEIGLRLDYWIDQRQFEEIEAENDEPSDALKYAHSLIVDCEACSASQYPPIRTSQAWLSSSVSDAISDPTLPIWDEPPPTFVPGTQIPIASDAINLGMATGTQPDVRFIAKLKPPVVLPLHAAAEILAHLGQPINENTIQFTTYLNLLFPDISGFQGRTDDVKVPIRRSLKSRDKSNNKITSSTRFEVFTQPSLWARTITELPFSHPRLLVDVLPYLRQWACFGRLLQRSFGLEAATHLAEKASDPGNSTAVHSSKLPAGNSRPRRPLNGYRHKYQHYEPPSDTDSDEDDGQTLQAAKHARKDTGQETTPSHNTSPVDIVVETTFTFCTLARRIDMAISMNYPTLRGGSYSCAANLKIHANATLEVEPYLALRGGVFDTKSTSESAVEKIRKKLEICLQRTENIGDVAAHLLTIIRQLERDGPGA